MIDTHAHLNFPELSKQVDKIIRESKKAGLKGIIIASSSLDDSKEAIKLAKENPGFLYASVGIHPQKTDPENKTSLLPQLANLEELIEVNKKSIVAIGETGLDFSEPPPGEEERSRQDQEELFLGQIKLALRHNLPVIVHTRESSDETIEFLTKHSNGKIKGVIHCYSGGKKRIQRIIDLPGKWYFGIDGNLTYDQGLQNVVSQIPQDKLLLETDSPFLAPEPHRGKICTPAYLPLIAKTVSQIWEKDLSFIAKQTSKNTQELFQI